MPKRALGLLIREYLISQRFGNPYDFWKKYARDIKYNTVVRYFWILRKLGLIESVMEVPNSKNSPIKIKVYTIVPGMETDPRWSAPQVALYPQTRWGGKRYKFLKAKGLIKTT